MSLKVVIPLLIAALAVTAGPASAGNRGTYMKRERCLSLVAEKHLTGKAYDDAMKECMVNPDEYK